MWDCTSVSESDTEYTCFDKAIAHFDRINAQDPNRILHQGREYPREWLYGQRMSQCLSDYAPDAGEALRLAARSQHIKRWVIARRSFPAGRQGYHRWRRTLADFHAETAAEILRVSGYGDSLIHQVSALLRKQNLQRNDADMQCLEDVICLVFLQYYLDDFAKRHNKEKIIAILRRTWRKMSPRGQATALSRPMPEQTKMLVEEALSGS